MTKRPPRKTATHVERVRRERGVRSDEPPESDLLTPDEMLETLRREVIAISRAAEIQIREFTIIVTDYARGKLSAEEANERYFQTHKRWADPMYGLSSFEDRTDTQLFKEMAEARREAHGLPRSDEDSKPRSR